MKVITRYVGLDVHKMRISVAIAEEGRSGEVRDHGVVENRADILIKLAERLGRRGERLHFCYEAGPCGYGLYRLLSGLGDDCTVVAPSLIPKKPGDRVKTNRRDATTLARLHRAGELTPVWVPDAAHEAMRDLVRARGTAARVLIKARQHLRAPATSGRSPMRSATRARSAKSSSPRTTTTTCRAGIRRCRTPVSSRPRRSPWRSAPRSSRRASRRMRAGPTGTILPPRTAWPRPRPRSVPCTGSQQPQACRWMPRSAPAPHARV